MEIIWKYHRTHGLRHFFLIFQRLRLDQTISIDPLTLLEKISREGISQDVCVNDLGTNPEEYSTWLSYILLFQHFVVMGWKKGCLISYPSLLTPYSWCLVLLWIGGSGHGQGQAWSGLQVKNLSLSLSWCLSLPPSLSLSLYTSLSPPSFSSSLSLSSY